MIDTLLCQPLNAIVKGLQETLLSCIPSIRKTQNKYCPEHKFYKTNRRHFEEAVDNEEFIRKYKSLYTKPRYNDISLIKTNSISWFSYTTRGDSGRSRRKHADFKSLERIVSSIRGLTRCVENYDGTRGKSGRRKVKREAVTRRTNNRKDLIHKRTTETYNYLSLDCPCLPKVHAASVLYKLSCLLEQILPYLGFIALNTRKENKDKNKLIKLHTIYLYLLYARKQLMKVTEYYTSNKDNQLVKTKMDSLWWALNKAKTELINLHKRSQINLTDSLIDNIIKTSILKDRESMFLLLKNCCLEENFLQNRKNKLRRSITDEYLTKPSFKILSAFKIDRKLLKRRPDSR